MAKVIISKRWRKLIGKVWGIYCDKCGTKMIPQGYYEEHSYCPHHPPKYEEIKYEKETK